MYKTNHFNNMKKLFLSLLVLAATMNAFAIAYTAKAKVVLTGTTTGQKCTMYLIQSDELNAGVNASYCGPIELDGRPVAFYAIYEATNYESFGTKDLGAMQFGLKTNADTEYTLKVSGVEGTQTLVMKDEVAGQTFDLVNNASYNFTATANTTVADRFHLYVAPAVPGICHYGNVLQVTGSNGMTVQINNMDDTQAIAPVAITSDSQDIDISGLTAGNQYKVVWNSQTLIIRK
jgi:hypothetical protein